LAGRGLGFGVAGGCVALLAGFTRCLPHPPPPPGEKIVQLIMEYVPLGSLRDYLPKHPVGLAHILLFAQQICEVELTPPRMALTPPKWL